MRENFPYRALRKLRQPGVIDWAYQPGDGVPREAVESWGLVIGEDVLPADTKVIPRPERGASRAEWEAFAVGQGLSPEEARDASLKDLRAIPEPDPEQPAEALPDPTAPPVRPDDDATKADWVDYVTRSGGSLEWARAKGTTKADLQAWEPNGQPTDEVAAAANDQAP